MQTDKKYGVILKRILYKESDYILKVLSQDSSLITFYVRGAAKSKKRFGGGVLEPTHLSEFSHQPPRGEDDSWLYLNEAKVVEGFEHIRKDYSKLEMALKMITTAAKVSKPGIGDDGELFSLLVNCLRFLEHDQKGLNLHLFFCARILKIQGNLPLNALDAILTENPSDLLGNQQLGEQLKQSDRQIAYLLQEHLGI